jgi:hypothetical protein
MRNILTKDVDKFKTRILCAIKLFQNRAVYEIMWKNMVEPDGTHENMKRRMCFACWITKATHTRSEYVILIAFSRQQWLRERASMLRYTYIASCRLHWNSTIIISPLLLL